MGCFLSCFRSKDRERQFISRPRGRSNSNSYYDLESLEDRLVLDNQIGSLFLNGATDTEDKCDHPHTLDEELRLEAKHLKLCGAILETPLEIRKSNNRIALWELNGIDQSPKSAQTLSNKKIQLFAQCEQESSPDQAIISAPDAGKETSISCLDTPGTESADEMRSNKLNLTPVRYSLGIRAMDPYSPYPTPITVNDDMQTPSTTIYSSYQETSRTAKRQAHIPVQYAYPALEPAQRVEISTNIKLSELEKENDLAGGFSFTKKSSEKTPKVLVPDLSEWLKPTTALRGIPNTTTTYEEDQQVKWHTTPFEERLERVLTDG